MHQKKKMSTTATMLQRRYRGPTFECPLATAYYAPVGTFLFSDRGSGRLDYQCVGETEKKRPRYANSTCLTVSTTAASTASAILLPPPLPSAAVDCCCSKEMGSDFPLPGRSMQMSLSPRRRAGSSKWAAECLWESKPCREKKNNTVQITTATAATRTG